MIPYDKDTLRKLMETEDTVEKILEISEDRLNRIKRGKEKWVTPNPVRNLKEDSKVLENKIKEARTHLREHGKDDKRTLDAAKQAHYLAIGMESTYSRGRGGVAPSWHECDALEILEDLKLKKENPERWELDHGVPLWVKRMKNPYHI